MGCAEIHLSSHMFTHVQAWIQIKKAGGGIGGRAQRLPQSRMTMPVYALVCRGIFYSGILCIKVYI